MATEMLILLIHICLSFIIISQALPDSDESPTAGGDISYWCQTTPHPEPCKYFLSHNFNSRPQNQTHFRQMMFQVALDRAELAQNYTARLESQCRSKRKKAAWNDCNKLLRDTILQLNRTLKGTKTHATGNNCSSFDAQTWLSAALTNLETCRSGSIELNVTKFIAPIIANNVSELISNSLAINQGFLTPGNDTNNNGGEEFPSWVTPGDRRLLQSSSWASRANVVVAKDRTGNFRSVQAAINYAAQVKRGNMRFIIYVKRGVYWENIAVASNLNNIMLVGDGLRYTVISSSRSVARGYTTYSSATAGIDGTGFIARGITFRNTAGPQSAQAVALRSASDLSVFYACGFEGYQDTLFVLAQRQFYKLCYIYGTIDFIFGNAAVVFQNCLIYVRRPLHGQVNVITAQGRADPFQNTGISIHFCRIMAAPDLIPAAKTTRTYLGRPWQQYSRTVLMKTYIDSLVSPQGWLAWQNSNFAWDTLYYGEYKNIGPGSSTRNRVKWKGYRAITSANEASRFTVANLIAGRAWLGATGVPFYSGL
ncbi:putative pectinesterase/pectinesterase inhibitor 33 [Apium graveolens]|uniref:putative pectinesterase/pectinesterase inhibitor 33 n=1 Tax=Apium graveolens TaxID=4045 RepID=UPI003D7BBDDD